MVFAIFVSLNCMKMEGQKAHIISALQNDILRLQGFKPVSGNNRSMGLEWMNQAFPNKTFPVGAVHEFISPELEDNAATVGFICGLLSDLMTDKGTVLWISSNRTLFPPALKLFGVQPDRFIFVDLKSDKDVLWALEEGLKCGALNAVICELKNLGFTESRRLQLAVEHSHVTGFILRTKSRNLSTTACVSRWRITSLPGEIIDDLPGVGYPKWKVELLRMRNGKSGIWEVIWKEGRFYHVGNDQYHSDFNTRKTG